MGVTGVTEWRAVFSPPSTKPRFLWLLNGDSSASPAGWCQDSMRAWSKGPTGSVALNRSFHEDSPWEQAATSPRRAWRDPPVSTDAGWDPRDGCGKGKRNGETSWWAEGPRCPSAIRIRGARPDSFSPTPRPVPAKDSLRPQSLPPIMPQKVKTPTPVVWYLGMGPEGSDGGDGVVRESPDPTEGWSYWNRHQRSLPVSAM